MAFAALMEWFISRLMTTDPSRLPILDEYGAFLAATTLLYVGGFVAFVIGLVLVVRQKQSSLHPRLRRLFQFAAAAILGLIIGSLLSSSIQTFAGDRLFWMGYQKPSQFRAGYDYNQLEQLLKTKQWKEADKLTTSQIRAASGTSRKSINTATLENFSRLPCADFQAIDRLWVKYSNGRFGFSVQRKIYDSIDGTLKQPNSPSFSDPKLDGFLRKVGEYRSDAPQFSLDDPVGALPSSGIALRPVAGSIFTYSIGESVKRQKWCGF